MCVFLNSCETIETTTIAKRLVLHMTLMNFKLLLSKEDFAIMWFSKIFPQLSQTISIMRTQDGYAWQLVLLSPHQHLQPRSATHLAHEADQKPLARHYGVDASMKQGINMFQTMAPCPFQLFTFAHTFFKPPH